MKNKVADQGRRDFLSFFPWTIFAAIAATMLTNAFRFLRPNAIAASSQKWTDVAPLAQLKGDKPVMHSIMTEQKAGWAATFEERLVYVLPQHGNQVISAVCPHEGCDVSWRDDTNQFICPCHDSFFNATGERISGPARRGLDPLPSRVENGTLQVQYQSFENNTQERVARG
ncbi:MAG: Rieske (2Fe-2S) protein [Pyrinomonadaceae bacterium]